MKKLMVVAIALAAAIPALAVDGQVLINQSTVIAMGGFPYVITQPGSYKLSGNLNGYGNCGYQTFEGNFQPALTTCTLWIQSTNVTIDLNGFTITGDPNYDGGAIGGGSISAANVVNTLPAFLTIRNGTIAASDPLLASAGWFNRFSYLVLEDLMVIKTSNFAGGVVYMGSYNRFRNVTAPSYIIEPTVSCTNVIQGSVFQTSLSTLGSCSSWTGNY